MAVPCYYPGFDVRRIGSDGFPVNPGVQTLNVVNLTAGGSLGTVASDANGSVVSGTFSATIGDIVEFSHATYAGTFRITLAETQELAYARRAGTPTATYILEDLYTESVNSDRIQFWAQDLDNLATAPFKLGEGYAGTTYVPYQTTVPKRLRIYPISITDEVQFEKNHFDTTNYVDVDIPAITLRCIFDHFTDKTTAGTSEETLYIDQIDAGQLGINGDKVTAEYSGWLAANANDKNIAIYFAGSVVGSSGTLSNNNSNWKVLVTLIRVSNTVIRYSTTFLVDGNVVRESCNQISSLDLASTDYDIELRAETPTSAGDVTAKMAHGLFIPAATTNTPDVMFEGETVTFGGDEVTFVP